MATYTIRKTRKAAGGWEIQQDNKPFARAITQDVAVAIVWALTQYEVQEYRYVVEKSCAHVWDPLTPVADVCEACGGVRWQRDRPYASTS